MNGISIWRFGALLAFSLTLSGFGLAPAFAQDAGSMSVQDIRECLCQQPQLQPLQNAWAANQRQLQEQQNQLANVDQQVSVQRQKLDPNDVVGQQVLKDLLSQQQQLREAIRGQYLPAANQSRDAYNAAVVQYNGKCTRPRYSGDEMEARRNLVCPAP